MKRIILLGVMFFCTVLSAKNITTIDAIYKFKDKEFNDCKASSFTILESNIDFKIALESRLYSFGLLKPTDFDMGECLSRKNLQNEVITTYFWQKNKKFVGNNLTGYVAYDYLTKKMLVVILDSDLNTYILGNTDNYLINALKNSNDAEDEIFRNINWASTRNFRNFGGKYLVPSKEDLLKMEQKRYEILKKDLLCKTIFDAAESIMKGRQAGITKNYQVQLNASLPYEVPELKKYELLLIDKAYDIPQYENTIDKFAVTKGFAYQSFFECHK